MYMLNKNNIPVLNRIYFWGFEKFDTFLTKFYYGFSGIYIFNKPFIGINLQSGYVVNNITNKKINSIRYINIYIILFFFSLEFNPLKKKKFNNFKFIGNYYNKKWYSGFSGIKIFNTKIIGISISNNIYNNKKYVWSFIYIFTAIFSIDIVGKSNE